MSTTHAPLSRKWRTIAERPYSPVTACDGRAAGGVVLVQARRRLPGLFQLRRVASNGGALVKIAALVDVVRDTYSGALL